MGFQKLVLVVPPQVLVMEGFRTALVALAAYVRRKLPDLQIRLLDLSGVPRTSLREVLQAEIKKGDGRTVVGISTVTADYRSALSVATELKAIDPDIVTIFGGHHASGDTDVILRNHPRLVDYIICHEGEIPLYQFLTSFPEIRSVPGLAFLSDGRVFRNASPKLLEEDELDCVPLTYEGWELSTSPGKFEHVTYVSARGCPLKCSFCSVANQKIRAKSVPQVVNDVRSLVGMGFSKVAFEDNFFAHNRERTRHLCQALANLQAEGVTFSWDCQTRVESMDHPETISLMQKAGCEAVYLGVESLNEEILRFLGKTQNPKRYLSRLTEHVVPALMDSNIDCYINLQFGLPGEAKRPDGIETNLPMLRRIGEMAARRGKKITIFPQLFVVYPGTSHFHRYVSLRQFPPDIFEGFTAWEAEQRPILNWLGETFAHGTGGLPLGILDHRGLWSGNYEVDQDAVARVTESISRVDGIEGLNIFRYGQYLVKENYDGQQAPDAIYSSFGTGPSIENPPLDSSGGHHRVGSTRH
jgi:radical SAM superfamily enzyme YgiQ (UPF0313 family)